MDNNMSLSENEIEAERVRFEADMKTARYQSGLCRVGDSYSSPSTSDRWEGFKARAEIARAEQAELRAEIERLRERVREFAKNELYAWLQESYPTAKMAWKNAPDRILGLAREAGVWFDDDGNEVPLDKWRARMGGAG